MAARHRQEESIARFPTRLKTTGSGHPRVESTCIAPNAGATFSSRRPNRPRSPFRVDPAAAIRDRLMQIYYSQKAFFKQNNKWATSLSDLKLSAAPGTARAYDEHSPHTGRL